MISNLINILEVVHSLDDVTQTDGLEAEEVAQVIVIVGHAKMSANHNDRRRIWNTTETNI